MRRNSVADDRRTSVDGHRIASDPCRPESVRGREFESCHRNSRYEFGSMSPHLNTAATPPSASLAEHFSEQVMKPMIVFFIAALLASAATSFVAGGGPLSSVDPELPIVRRVHVDAVECPLESMTILSTDIAVVEIVQNIGSIDPGNGLVRTRYKAFVEEWLKEESVAVGSPASTGWIYFDVGGGTVVDEFDQPIGVCVVAGAPTFQIGERVLLFLWRDLADNENGYDATIDDVPFGIVGLSQGTVRYASEPGVGSMPQGPLVDEGEGGQSFKDRIAALVAAQEGQ